MRSASWSNRTVVLLTGRWSDHSYAYIKSGYNSDDLVWVDRSYDGGTNWSQCGPFKRRSSNDLLNEGNWMRACMRVTSAAHSFCTGWYYDHTE
ncbi:hypothetical protein AB0F77_31480 [Streptomyces sp. NPDC026672]|uniref:hypothetical protein n=1 Tax=unclassified Streptomyces TaxID=2593676 RepID=UPI0033F6A3D5